MQGNLSGSSQVTGVGFGTPIAWLTKADSAGIFGKANNFGLNAGSAPLTDTNGVTFNMSNEFGAHAMGLADYGLNSSGVVVPGTYQAIIPIGIFGVTSVDTMLQDTWASSAAGSVTGAPNPAGQSTAVTFEFSTTSDGSGAKTFETVYLTNGQEIRNGITCATGCAGLGAYQTGYAPTSVLTGYIATTLGGSLDSTNPDTSTVDETFTPNLYTAAYSSMGAFNAYSNSTGGTVQRDDQSFSFGNTYTNEYLVAVILNNQMDPNASKISLAAITVEQAAVPTPEPSTLVLILIGLGSIGVSRLRRKKKSSL